MARAAADTRRRQLLRLMPAALILTIALSHFTSLAAVQHVAVIVFATNSTLSLLSLESLLLRQCPISIDDLSPSLFTGRGCLRESESE